MEGRWSRKAYKDFKYAIKSARSVSKKGGERLRDEWRMERMR